MTPDERLEKLLNRAGQTISDLPSPIDYNIEQEELAMEAAADFGGGLEAYILHLTDVIDRLEQALENQVTLHENLMHVIGNADIPESVDYEDFSLVVDSIYKAVQLAQEGWESYEGGVPEDQRIDDGNAVLEL